MKKILSTLFVLVILVGAFQETASANRYDELPTMGIKSFPIEQVNLYE